MKCAFCGHRTGNEATHHTTESDFVCLDCAMGFELALEFGEEWEIYENGEASAELVARIEESKRDWEAHFEQQAMPKLSFTIPDSLIEQAWPELKIELVEGEYRIEIQATAYDGIRYFWKLIHQQGKNDYLGQDRLFETKGQALDDALEFMENLQFLD